MSWPSSPGRWSWRRAHVSCRADLRCWLDSDLNTFKHLLESEKVQEYETDKLLRAQLRYFNVLSVHPVSVRIGSFNSELLIYSCSDFKSLNWAVWELTVDAGDWEVVFGFLPAGMRLDGSRRPTGDLALPEEGHHEGLLGARPPPAHQPDPACRQGAVWGRETGDLIRRY